MLRSSIYAQHAKDYRFEEIKENSSKQDKMCHGCFICLLHIKRYIYIYIYICILLILAFPPHAMLAAQGLS